MEASEGVTMRLSIDKTILIAAACLSLAASSAIAAPEIGKPAPEFLFVGASEEGSGARFQSSDYVGEGARKKGVVVAWFPKAFTPG